MNEFISTNGSIASDEKLEEIAGKLLINKGKTLSVAESCTGGLISNRITNVSGASKYFKAGFITYSNEAKIRDLGVNEENLKKFGSVSEIVASEMALGARKRAGSDYAVAVTGIAGPTGGCDGKPVGIVFIAVADIKGVEVKKYFYPGDRLYFKDMVSSTALSELIIVVSS